MTADYDRYGELFLKALGVTMALISWHAVVSGKRVKWKGGNRAPLSVQSKVLFAVGMTAWTFALFGLYPMYGAEVFAICMGLLFFLARKDRRAYDRLCGVGPIKPLPIAGRDLWLVFWAFDAFTLTGSGVALIRDFFSPPVTNDQHIVHIMALGLFTISIIGVIALLVNRPQKGM